MGVILASLKEPGRSENPLEVELSHDDEFIILSSEDNGRIKINKRAVKQMVQWIMEAQCPQP